MSLWVTYTINKWITPMIQRQPELSGKIRWTFQFMLRWAAAPIVLILMMSMFASLKIVSGALESSIWERSKDGVRTMVEAMATVIESTVPPGDAIGPEMDKTVRERVTQIIHNAQFPPNVYLMLFDVEGFVIAQGTRPADEDVGGNHFNYKDVDEFPFIQELIKAAQRKQGEFVSYKWPKQNGGTPYRKSTYPRLLKGDRWWIASGVYHDTVEQVLQESIVQHYWYILLATSLLVLVTATFLLFISQLGEVLGERIAQPVLEQMKGLTKTGDEERSLLAVALHDLVSEDLINPLKPTLSQMAHAMDTTTRQTLKQQASKIIADFDDKCHDVERDIYPPAVRCLGVGTAVKHKVKEMTQGHNALHIKHDIDESIPQSDPGRECALYRIAQGLFQNVLKSAQATQVNIELAIHGETVTLTVKDNGNGFDVDPVVYEPWKARSRFGIQWMLAQAAVYEGHIKFTSKKRQADSPEHGTTVHVTMRWPKPETKNGS